jgi:hypothetical protein
MSSVCTSPKKNLLIICLKNQIHRRNSEDLNLLSIILNQEIRRLATQVKHAVLVPSVTIGYACKLSLKFITKSIRVVDVALLNYVNDRIR